MSYRDSLYKEYIEPIVLQRNKFDSLDSVIECYVKRIEIIKTNLTSPRSIESGKNTGIDYTHEIFELR
jgi:deoxyribodipyrimidine photolyase